MPDARTSAVDEGVALGPLEGTVGFMLRLVQLQLFDAFHQRFAPHRLRPGEYATLVAIGENPGIRQGVLARALMIRRSNMAKVVRALMDKGLVERTVPPADRRALELCLTAEGRTLVDGVLPEIVDHDRGATWMLSEEEREALLATLHKIAGRAGAGEPIDTRMPRGKDCHAERR